MHRANFSMFVHCAILGQFTILRWCIVLSWRTVISWCAWLSWCADLKISTILSMRGVVMSVDRRLVAERQVTKRTLDMKWPFLEAEETSVRQKHVFSSYTYN